MKSKNIEQEASVHDLAQATGPDRELLGDNATATADSIAQIDGLTDGAEQEGEEVAPGHATGGQLAPDGVAVSKFNGPSMFLGGTTYVWKKGDQASTVAEIYYGDGSDYRLIMSANRSKFANGRRPQPGDTIEVPRKELDVLRVLLRFKDQTESLRMIVTRMPDHDFAFLFESLQPREREMFAKFFERIKELRGTAATVQALAAKNHGFLDGKGVSSNIDTGKSADPFAATGDRAVLEALLDHQEATTRYAAVEAIADIGAYESREALQRRKAIEPDGKVRGAIRKALLSGPLLKTSTGRTVGLDKAAGRMDHEFDAF